MGCVHGKCCGRYPQSSDGDLRDFRDAGPYSAQRKNILSERSLEFVPVPSHDPTRRRSGPRWWTLRPSYSTPGRPISQASAIPWFSPSRCGDRRLRPNGRAGDNRFAAVGERARDRRTYGRQGGHSGDFKRKRPSLTEKSTNVSTKEERRLGTSLHDTEDESSCD